MEQKHQKKLFRRIYDKSKNALKKAILGTTVALGIGAAAIACGGRPDVCDNGSPYCYPGKQDAGMLIPLDSGMPQQDARTQNDAVQFDAQPKQDAGNDARQNDSGTDAQQTDGGVQPPQYSYTINNLIGDYLNRDLLDRDNGAKDYSLSTSETDQNANPFSDGAGGSIGLDKTSMNRVDGTMFPPFATNTLMDFAAAREYDEQQDLWVGGDSHYSNVAHNMVGNINFVSYTLKFKGTGDDFGIPVCTTPTNNDYASCKDTSAGGNIDYATETHKLRVKFLGDDWILSEMYNPTTTLTSENAVINGGYVKLAKESVSGILNQNESIAIDNLTFRLDDLETIGNSTRAIFSVLDANGNILKKDTIGPAETKEIVVNGRSYLFHCYKVAPNYPLGAKWANLAFFSKELKLMDGQKLDPDYDNNRYWKIYLGWKNRGASVTDTTPDHLRTIILYADDIAKLSSGGRTELIPGDYIPIVQDPVKMTLAYKGLSATPSTYSTLQFDLERNSNFTISSTYGPNGQACTINVPYVRVTSSLSGSVFKLGLSSDSSFLVAANGGNCNNTPFLPGTGFIKKSPSSEIFDIANMPSANTTVGYNVKYLTAADSSGTYGGVIPVIKPGPTTGLEPSLKVYFNITESAGENASVELVDVMAFGVKVDGAASTLNFDMNQGGSTLFFKKDNVRYFYSGPVSTGIVFAPEGFVTERGSKFVSMTDTTVTFNIAGELVYSQFYLATK